MRYQSISVLFLLARCAAHQPPAAPDTTAIHISAQPPQAPWQFIARCEYAGVKYHRYRDAAGFDYLCPLAPGCSYYERMPSGARNDNVCVASDQCVRLHDEENSRRALNRGCLVDRYPDLQDYLRRRPSIPRTSPDDEVWGYVIRWFNIPPAAPKVDTRRLCAQGVAAYHRGLQRYRECYFDNLAPGTPQFQRHAEQLVSQLTTALEEFERAYASCPDRHPELLFYMGLCEEQIGSLAHLHAALFHYQGYLRAVPKTADPAARAYVEALVQSLQKILKRE